MSKETHINSILATMREIHALSTTDVHAYLKRQREFLELWEELDKFLQSGGFWPNMTIVRNGWFLEK